MHDFTGGVCEVLGKKQLWPAWIRGHSTEKHSSCHDSEHWNRSSCKAGGLWCQPHLCAHHNRRCCMLGGQLHGSAGNREQSCSNIQPFLFCLFGHRSGCSANVCWIIPQLHSNCSASDDMLGQKCGRAAGGGDWHFLFLWSNRLC